MWSAPGWFGVGAASLGVLVGSEGGEWPWCHCWGPVTRPMRYLLPGFVPLPLPAVLGVAKDQPKSPLDDPRLAEPSPRAPLPALCQADEEDGG